MPSVNCNWESLLSQTTIVYCLPVNPTHPHNTGQYGHYIHDLMRPSPYSYSILFLVAIQGQKFGPRKDVSNFSSLIWLLQRLLKGLEDGRWFVPSWWLTTNHSLRQYQSVCWGKEWALGKNTRCTCQHTLLSSPLTGGLSL